MAQSLLSRWANGAVNPAGICCTIRIGTGRSRGRQNRMSCNALGPPVELPMATIADVAKSHWSLSVEDRGRFRPSGLLQGGFRDCAADRILPMRSERMWAISRDAELSCLGT